MPLIHVTKATVGAGRGARTRLANEPMAEIRRAFARLVASAEVDSDALEMFASGGGNDPVPWDEDAFRREVSAALLRIVQAAGDYELGVVEREGRYAVVEKAKAPKLDTTDEEALRWIRAEAGSLIEGMSQRKLKALRALLVQATERGESPQQLGRRIVRDKLAGLLERDVNAVENLYRRLIRDGKGRTRAADLAAKYQRRLLAQRAERIARTEMSRAWGAGQVAGWKQAQRSGLLDKNAMIEWLNGGPAPCPVCLRLHGKRVKVGRAFYPGGYFYPGETHPSCLPGTVSVQSPSAILATSARQYDGRLVRIRTKRGNELSCTPNHPILTHAGWVSASSLYVGCHVFSRGSRERILACDVNGQDVPAVIHEVAHAFGLRARVLAVEVPVSAEDFHGDGAGSEVAVVRTDSDLGRHGHAEIGEQLAQFNLNGRDVRSSVAESLAPDGAATLDGHRPLAAARRVVSGLDHVRTLSRSALGPDDELLSAHAASSDAALLQAQINGDASDSEPLGQGEHAFPGDVTADEIVSVDMYPFSGQVLNLQTASGWYLAEGIITHNCECLLVLVVDVSRRRRQRVSS